LQSVSQSVKPHPIKNLPSPCGRGIRGGGIASLLALFLILLSSPFIAIAGTIQLPQTGQKTCYDINGVVISCPGTGQDGDIQAGVPWPSPRFIDHGNDTVTDNLTGLMWTKNANLPGTYKTWQQALDYVAGMNAGTYPNFGYTDWRLPNINEHESLIDAELWGPALSAGHPFTNVQGGGYWSSTSYAGDSNNAWLVRMSYGIVDYNGKSISYNYVWPVRSGQNGIVQLPQTGQTTSYAGGDDGDWERGVAWPVPRFTDQGNGTVTDNLTGLMWTKNANLPGTYKTWQQALDYVKGMNAGTYSNFGYTDWRLPNRKELQSLIDRSRYNPALPSGHPFTSVQGDSYWSSTSYVGNGARAWIVYMDSGYVSYYGGKSNPFYVWPVRGGGEVDTTPPTGSIIINNNAVWTKTTAVALKLNCTDSESGCADMRFSNDNINFTDWEPFSTNKPWVLSSVDGDEWVYVQYRDWAGNSSESFFDSINLDTTKPVVKGVSDSPDPFRHHLGEVSKIRFTLSDNLSGTCKVQGKIYNSVSTLVRTIKKNGVSCPPEGAAVLLKWDGKDKNGVFVPAGTYTYKIQATDNATNKSAIKQGAVGVE